MASKIPVAVSSHHRGHLGTGLTTGLESRSPPSSSCSSPSPLGHHPHYQNHRSPSHRTSAPITVQQSSTSHSQQFSNPQSASPSHQQLSSTISPPKFEAFMMTGDLIINLAKHESRDINAQLSNQELLFRRRRQNRTAPNLHSSSIQFGEECPKSCSTSGHVDMPHSLPNSPASIESRPFSNPDSTNHVNPVQEPQKRDDKNGTGSSGTGFNSVRLSRSEDHLLKHNLSASVFEDDLDIDLNNQSNSCDMLLNDDSESNVLNPVVKPVGDKVSHSSSPSMATSTSSSSNVSTNGSNHDSSTATGSGRRRGSFTISRTGSSRTGTGLELTTDEETSTCSTGGAQATNCSSNNLNSVSNCSSSSSGSYTASTTTPISGTGLESVSALSSLNCSPTKAVASANFEQTESSMSEGYSIVSSIHNQQSLATGSANPVHGLGLDLGHKKVRHANTLSLSSSNSNCSSVTASPQDFNPITSETLIDDAVKVNSVRGLSQAPTMDIDSNDGQSNSSSQQSPAKKVLETGLVNLVGDIAVGDLVAAGGECGPRRYPTFITTESNIEQSSNLALANLINQQETAALGSELVNPVQGNPSSSIVPPPPPVSDSPPTSSSDDELDLAKLESSLRGQLKGQGSPKLAKAEAQVSPPKSSVDVASASRLAKRLFKLEGFKKSDVSRHLSKNNDFARIVAEEYLKFFDFKDDTLDAALRKFLLQFSLIGETQERERVLVHFARRFLDCNPGAFKSADAVHTLTCAIMMLNTDLHGENVGRKMTCAEFIENLSELHEGENFPKETLRALYTSIKNQSLQWAFDSEEEQLAASNRGTGTLASMFGNSNGSGVADMSAGSNPFLEPTTGGTSGEAFKKGYIMRKCCFDSTGKRTPLGKRGWKMFYATLRDMVLYLHKDESGFRKNQLYESLHNSVRVHHAMAEKATDYSKKEFVFRLQTADQAEYLFQTSDARELQSWVDTINLVAATLSAPPLPAAVGSQTKKFQRPLLPVSHTKLNARDQLVDHEKRIAKMESELEMHLSKMPEAKSARSTLQEYQEKEMYLQSELKRYKTYSLLLKMQMQKQLGQQAMDKVVKSALSSMKSSKPLTSVAIGEESSTGDDNGAVDGQESTEEPVIKPVKRNDRFGQQKRLR